MKHSANPSAIRSREMLTEALLTLMQKKSYQEISIKDIATKADLNRRTFYRNFENKDDIIFTYGNELVSQLGTMIQLKEDFSFFTICESYFEFWLLNLDFLMLLKNNNMLYFLFEQFNHFHDKLHLFLPASHEHAEDSNYSAAFALGGFWSILVEWLNSGAKRTPRYMATLICHTIRDPFAE